MVGFRNVANFDAVWLPRWRRAGVRAYTAKKSKKKVCSDYLFENSCSFTVVSKRSGTTADCVIRASIIDHQVLL